MGGLIYINSLYIDASSLNEVYLDNYDYVENNNIPININSVSMDDYYLKIMFSVNLEDTDYSNIEDLEFIDMLISDENKNILYCEEQKTFDDYCISNNLNFKWKETNDNYINSGSSFYIESQESNIINFVYKFYANNFPKSKKLYVDFSKIKLTANKNVILNGKWNLDIDVPEEFYNREVILYQVEECSNPNFKIEDVIVTDRVTKLIMQTEEKPDLPYDENDDEETKNRKIDEALKESLNDTFEDFQNRKKFKNEYIENENGEKFYPANSSSEDSGYSNTEMKYLNYWQTFNMGSKDATNKLTIYINYKGENMYIHLKRK